MRKAGFVERKDAKSCFERGMVVTVGNET